MILSNEYPLSAEGRGSAALLELTDRLFRAGALNDVYDACLDALTELLDCDRASILLFDERGIMRFVSWRGLSDAYRQAVDGHTPWAAGEQSAEPIFVSDIQETAEPEWLKSCIASERIVGLAFIPLFASGRLVGKFMTYFPAHRQFTEFDRACAVAVARQVGFALERYRSEAARVLAENRLRESEGRFRQMAEEAPIMIWISDRDNRCLHLNRLLRSFWSVEDIADFDWTGTIHPDDREGIGEAMREAVRTRSSARVKGRYRRHDGAYRVLETVAQPSFDPAGAFTGMIGVNVDVTEREEADQHTRLLINELNHRVKNTLAVVQALSRQTFRSDAPRKAQQQTFEGRLSALADAHNLLAAENWRSASLGEVVRRSVNADVDPRMRVAGPAVTLEPKQAVTTAMALHELYTNAVKHGALRTPDGRVTFEWTTDGHDDAIEMRWSEESTIPVQVPTRRGFGSTMIEQALVAELGAEVEVDYRPLGLVCTVRARLGTGKSGT